MAETEFARSELFNRTVASWSKLDDGAQCYLVERCQGWPVTTFGPMTSEQRDALLAERYAMCQALVDRLIASAMRNATASEKYRTDPDAAP